MRILALRSVCHVTACAILQSLPESPGSLPHNSQYVLDAHHYRQGTERTPRYRKFCAKVLNFFGELFVLFYTLILGQKLPTLAGTVQSRNQYGAHDLIRLHAQLLPRPAMAQNMEYPQPSCFFGLPCCRHCNAARSVRDVFVLWLHVLILDYPEACSTQINICRFSPAVSGRRHIIRTVRMIRRVSTADGTHLPLVGAMQAEFYSRPHAGSAVITVSHIL